MPETILDVQDLSFAYPGSPEDTLKNLSFNIREGMIFGLLGPSGAGKTSTQKILMGLLANYRGAVQVLGKEIGSWKSDLYKIIGIAFEYPALHGKLTARENMEFFGALMGADRKNVKESINYAERLDLGDHLDKRIQDYSKGMKARLNFCRSLIHDPQILFLDEPSAGLDPVNANELKRIILELKNEGKTIFLTTHNMALADSLCDELGILMEGKLYANSSPRELKTKASEEKVEVVLEIANEELREQFPLENLGTNSRFLQFIRSGTVKEINSQLATLEQVFLQLTGKMWSGV